MPLGFKLLKQKLIEYHNYGKPEPLPDYAVHTLVYIFTTGQDMVKFHLFDIFLIEN
jgi:hypothetical protein